MKQIAIKVAVLGALGLVSAQAMATGFVNLPTAGLNLSGGTSSPVTPYARCNDTGDFGSGTSTAPTAGAHNVCAVFPANPFVAPAPYASFSLVTSNTQTVVMPAPYAGANPNVATITDAVFRNAAKTECVYAAFVHMNNAPLANGENWELNDLARGGFSSKGTVQAAYYYTAISDESVFRAGRAHTAVRHMVGEPDLPLFSGAPAASTPITSTGKAALSANWVDFTTDVNALDPDGSTFPDTSVMYVHTTCTSATPALFTDAIRLRSTGQEGQQQIEVKVPGYAPPGSTINLY